MDLQQIWHTDVTELHRIQNSDDTCDHHHDNLWNDFEDRKAEQFNEPIVLKHGTCEFEERGHFATAHSPISAHVWPLAEENHKAFETFEIPQH
ncbi:unnamed protein product [Angiostrongylus costaricensis]|uniref:Uncharacterized protein n=1 Tax=Angiostrongylus costaricensis TaxID=334426 RepID=A0A0R3Q2P9_ANGCS|nr:unnamed protein product [Angiostrongylus costaricensis]